MDTAEIQQITISIPILTQLSVTLDTDARACTCHNYIDIQPTTLKLSVALLPQSIVSATKVKNSVQYNVTVTCITNCDGFMLIR